MIMQSRPKQGSLKLKVLLREPKSKGRRPLMKILKKRDEHANTHEADLRGLGRELLFTDSFPYAVLVTSPFAGEEQLQRLCGKFKLENFHATHSEFWHFRTRHRSENQHNHQAIDFFLMSKEVLVHSAKTKLFLTVYHPLHHHLTQSTRDLKPQPWDSGEVHQWVKEGCHHGLTVGQSALSGLSQAGLAIGKGPFSGADLEILIKEHLKSTESKQHLRATG